MKKLILSLMVFTLFVSSTKAQKMHLNVYSSYVFDNSFTSNYVDNTSMYYSGKIKGGFQYGLGLEFLPHPELGIELLYIGQKAKVTASYSNAPIKSSESDMGTNYVMTGFNRYLRKPGSKVEGYGGLMLGVVWGNITNTDYDISSTITKFAWGIRGGLNIWASEKVAIKMQAQLLSAPQEWGGGFYFGTGGSGASVGVSSTLYQFSLGGGLSFALGKGNKKQ